uniref:stAR-related lipid transfer protein 13-like n=1 Tax=Pristiophorus japonicus TaxID=55135 RepID=UPI00398F51B9
MPGAPGLGGCPALTSAGYSHVHRAHVPLAAGLGAAISAAMDGFEPPTVPRRTRSFHFKSLRTFLSKMSDRRVIAPQPERRFPSSRIPKGGRQCGLHAWLSKQYNAEECLLNPVGILGYLFTAALPSTAGESCAGCGTTRIVIASEFRHSTNLCADHRQVKPSGAALPAVSWKTCKKDVPKDQCLQALQAAIVLMPDENREVLQSLLYFLSDIASVQQNQMTAGNLAVCLAPSLFHLNVLKKETSSPRVIRRRGVLSKPDQRDLDENRAATEGLGHMITECKKLFQIPHDIMVQSRNSYIAADAHPLPMEGFRRYPEGRVKDYIADMEHTIQGLVREAGEKFKGWTSTVGPVNTELSYKKVGDGHPIRLWKVTTEVEAAPRSVLNRLLRERHLWDDDVLMGKVVEHLDKNIEICHYVLDSMAPHPRRDFVVLRTWRDDLLKDLCILVAVSVEHDSVHLEGGVRAVVLNSQYLVEACGSGRSRLTHISRTDLRGRTPDWYNKVSGYLCAVEVARIRDSFLPSNPRGLETKI